MRLIESDPVGVLSAELSELLSGLSFGRESTYCEGSYLAVHIFVESNMESKDLVDVSLVVTPKNLPIFSDRRDDVIDDHLEEFEAALKDGAWQTRVAACKALGQMGEDRAVQLLESAAGDSDSLVARAATMALQLSDESRVGKEDLAMLRAVLTQGGEIYLGEPLPAPRAGRRFLRIDIEQQYKIRGVRRSAATQAEVAPVAVLKAAQSRDADNKSDTNILNRWQFRMELGGERLHCKVIRNPSDGRLSLRFRSDVTDMRQGIVHIEILPHGGDIIIGKADLIGDKEGDRFLTASFPLPDDFRLENGGTICFGTVATSD